MSLSQFPTVRLRRLRQNKALRELIHETTLNVNQLVFPLFIKESLQAKQPVSSMPGIFQLSFNDLSQEIREIQALGITSILLFGIPSHKDANGDCGCDEHGIIAKSISAIKEQAPDLFVIADNCFCEYTDHGHCGPLHSDQKNMVVDNDKTLAQLAKQVVAHAKAGADMLAPSGMMDGMVTTIRQALDQSGFSHLPILSYSSKFASAFYGSFREAAECAPQFGDRANYQLDPRNANQAIHESTQDVLEGADILMVKPALPYLDIIHRIKQKHPELPLAAYQVSGEYSMIKAAAAQGWLNEKKIALESLTAIKRAGADFIISYYAKEVAAWLNG